MKSIAFVILLSSLQAAFAHPASTWTVMGKEFAVDTVKHCQLGPGTSLTILDLTGDHRQRVFFTTTDLTNPLVQIKTICGNNDLKTNMTVPQMASNKGDKNYEYFAGVNSDLFSGNGPIGTTIVGSEIYKTVRTSTGWYSVGCDSEKHLSFGQFYPTFKLVSTATGQMSAKSVNTPRESNDFVVFTDKYGASTGTSANGVEVAAVSLDNGLSAYGTSRYKVTAEPQSGAGNMSIPAGGIVLSANASWYMDPLKKLKVGDIIEITPTFSLNGKAIDQIQEMSGGCPMILQDGSILNTDKVLDHLSSRRPRTAVGIDKTGAKMVMMVVDGDKFNAGISDGITSKELASMMQNAGCHTAINFDGGGSSTIYSEALGVLNRPSDGQLRKVRNGWFLAAPKTDDTNVVSIAFADYAKTIAVGTAYKPIVYGYNKDGYLIDANLAGCSLSCPLGSKVSIDNGTLTFSQAGTYQIEASRNGSTAKIQITVTDNSGITLPSADGSKMSVTAEPGVGVRITIPYDSGVRLFNCQGVCLKNVKCKAGTIVIPTSGLSSGLYFTVTDKETRKLYIK